jgi:hypothetical protein
MRRLSPKCGRPCSICQHRKSRQIEAAVTAGTSLRTIGKSYGVSPWAVLRHREHMPPPVVRQSSALALYEELGRPSIKRSDIIVSRSDTINVESPKGAPTPPGVPVAAPPAVVYKHPPMWVTMRPRPRMGARCEKCGGNYFWEAGNRECGGCVKCWHPAIDGRMSHFYT